MFNKLLLAALTFGLSLTAFAQNNLLYGLMGVPGPGTNTAAGTTHLGTLDVNTGTFTQISPNSLASVTSATGAALDPVSQTYYFQTQTAFVATSMQTGLPTLQNGIYFLEVQTANGLELVKVVK